MKKNYGKLLDDFLAELDKSGRRPTLLLHSCCAPCSSYVLEYLYRYFKITLFFYNPNITSHEEFEYRLSELKRFVSETGYNTPIIAPPHRSDEFFAMSRGLESLPECGERCRGCYSLRLVRTAEEAVAGGYDYFTTTLSISPHKNAEWINEIGAGLENELGSHWLFSDFKKKNGYLRSIELSKQYSLYRQSFCGCVYSKIEAEKRENRV